MTLARRPLGRSGLSTAPFALGTNVFGWNVDAAGAFRILDAFVDAGFDFLDTADLYPAWVPGNEGGESETIIGQWLARSGKRAQVTIATKVAKWPRRRGLSPDTIAAAADDSLRRLGVDAIDVYFAHEDDPSVPMAETLGAFARLVEAGKVRALGASNIAAERLSEALATSAQLGLPRYEVLQPEYNLVDRADYERQYAAWAEREGLGVVPYFSLARGFLTGKYRGDDDVAKSSARGGEIAERYFNGHGRRVLTALDDVARRHSATPAQIALAWLMARPGITAPIASATSVAQLEELLGAARIALSEDDLARLDAPAGAAASARAAAP